MGAAPTLPTFTFASHASLPEGHGFSPASAPGLLPPEPMATPGEFAPVPSLEARSRRRIVLRSTPVRRSISRCPRPWRSSVSTVIRRCDFKTFNSPPPVQIGSSVTSRRLQTLGADRRPFTSGVGEFQVATGGGFWVAARAAGRSDLLHPGEHLPAFYAEPVVRTEVQITVPGRRAPGAFR